MASLSFIENIRINLKNMLLCGKDGVTDTIRIYESLGEEVSLLYFPNHYALKLQLVWQVNNNFSES